MKTNILLPALGAVALGIVGWVGLASTSSNHHEVEPISSVRTLNSDEETVDALKTVAARLKQSDQENDTLKQRLSDLESQLKKQNEAIAKVARTQSAPASSPQIPLPITPRPASPPGVVTNEQQKTDAVLKQVSDLALPYSGDKPFKRLPTFSSDPLANAFNSMPSGSRNQLPGVSPKQITQTGYVRIKPLNYHASDPPPAPLEGYAAPSASPQAPLDFLNAGKNALKQASASATHLVTGSSVGSSGPGVEPYVTIPANSTFMDSVTMTALIGRVPINGDITDPVPFKVLVGSRNLAANGHVIPGLDGMILSGRATGDRTFSCVYGHVDSATFIFSDGRIVSHSGGSQSNTSRGRSLGISNGLAWLSDPYGNPCIPGTYVSNAVSSIGTSIVLGGAIAGTEAFAEAQTTTRDSGSGTSRSVDDPKDFLLGRVLSGGARGGSERLSRFQPDDWDAVYLPAGTSVVVNLEQQLLIDLVPDARRVIYPRHALGAGGVD